jgi:hypothetical protein
MRVLIDMAAAPEVHLSEQVAEPVYPRPELRVLTTMHFTGGTRDSRRASITCADAGAPRRSSLAPPHPRPR